MNSTPRASATDVATELGGLSAGLGTLSFALFPLAVPGLLFVIAPLAMLAVAGALLALPIVLPLWLARSALRRFSARLPSSQAPPHRFASRLPSACDRPRERSRRDRRRAPAGAARPPAGPRGMRTTAPR